MLDFCAGSGRNSTALRAAGLEVVDIADSAADVPESLSPSLGTFAAVLSTHGLLHGTVPAIHARIARIWDRLEPAGLLCATFGSVRDARWQSGRRIAGSTFAPLDGDESGVAHSFFTRTEIESLLGPYFDVEILDERWVDGVAGTWAHRKCPLSGAVHWFAVAGRCRS